MAQPIDRPTRLRFSEPLYLGALGRLRNTNQDDPAVAIGEGHERPGDVGLRDEATFEFEMFVLALANEELDPVELRPLGHAATLAVRPMTRKAVQGDRRMRPRACVRLQPTGPWRQTGGYDGMLAQVTVVRT